MNVFRVVNPDPIKAFITQPDIWATAAMDGQDPRTFAPDIRLLWLMVEREGVLLALYCFKRENRVTLDGHLYVPISRRGKQARETFGAVVAWLNEHLPEWEKITAMVPVCYRNIRRFLVGLGFSVEGRSLRSYAHGGELIDRWLMGINKV